MSTPLFNDFATPKYIPTGSIPLGTDVAELSGTITTGNWGTFSFYVYPAEKSLSLWNFFYNVYVDTDSSDYNWPNGSSLSSTQRSIRVYTIPDWANSDDSINKRAFRIIVENFSGSNRTVYIKFKSYSYAYVT